MILVQLPACKGATYSGRWVAASVIVPYLVREIIAKMLFRIVAWRANMMELVGIEPALLIDADEPDHPY